MNSCLISLVALFININAFADTKLIINIQNKEKPKEIYSNQNETDKPIIKEIINSFSDLQKFANAVNSFSESEKAKKIVSDILLETKFKNFHYIILVRYDKTPGGSSRTWAEVQYFIDGKPSPDFNCPKVSAPKVVFKANHVKSQHVSVLTVPTEKALRKELEEYQRTLSTEVGACRKIDGAIH